MIRIDRLLYGMAALTVFSLNPLESSAEVRTRFTGSGCLPIYGNGDGTEVHVSPGALGWAAGGGATRGASCPILTGPELVSLIAGSEHEIGQVNARLYQGSAANVVTNVYVHDHDSADFCTCGSTTGSNSGFFQRTMPFNCGSCSYASDWGITMGITPNTAQGLSLRLVSVHDKD